MQFDLDNKEIIDGYSRSQKWEPIAPIFCV